MSAATTPPAEGAPLLLRWTRFASDAHGTGPEKRSAQIRALCASAGLGVSDMVPPAKVPRWRARWAGLEARWRWGARASVDHAGAGLLGYRACFYREALARHAGARVLLWETTYDSLLPALAREAGYRVIAVPHNLESLVSEAVFADPRYDPTGDLGAEVRRLAQADAVYAIAREERWFLETRGIGADYLPYYPDPALAAECRRIRERREARSGAPAAPGPLLVLGSALNPATARGMRRQLEWLAAAPNPPPAGVVVAGRQTERELAGCGGPGVVLRGGVSRGELAELMETCSALLIHTIGGGGAVTRIPEALLAGIPVIANANAARDQYDTPGVHVYADAPEFIDLTRRPLPVPPAPPVPAAAELRFTEQLRRLALPPHA
jgi:hypothetical protein